jgi:hypothetical protein
VGVSVLGNNFLLINQESLDVFIQGITSNTSLVLNDGLFHHVVVTWRSSDGQLIVYVDGISVFSATTQLGFSFTANGSLVLGQDQDNIGGGFDGTMSLDGILDEIRISDNFRNADYVATTFNNQDNPGAFYSISPSESQPTPDIMGYEE